MFFDDFFIKDEKRMKIAIVFSSIVKQIVMDNKDGQLNVAVLK